jgi:secreted Zn-dependent insulinase-like peptidase
VQAFLPKLLSAVHVEMLAHGNLTAAEAMEAAAIARRTLLAGATPLPAASRPQERVVRVGGETATTACVRVVERVKNSNEENSAVESYFQV